MFKRKAISIILLSVLIFSSCSKVNDKISDDCYETTPSATIQSESPYTTPEITTTTESETETTTQTTTSKKPVTTTAKVTSKAPVTTPVYPPTGSYNALNYNVQKGVWISYLEAVLNCSGKSEAQFRASIAYAYRMSKENGINTVYVQVRSHGDAWYPSSIYPWSRRCSSGRTSPGYDPLLVMVEEAHKLGLSFHAWINPYRLDTPANMQALSVNPNDNSVIKQWYNDPSKKGKYLVSYGDFYYLNPGYPEVRALIANGVSEIVSRYQVDGVHIDDYFYPSYASDDFDYSAFSSSGASNRDEWRRSNIDASVRQMYSAVKSVNSRTLFGISPAGNVSNCVYALYANLPKWLSTTGYMDYVVPQIYWGFNNPVAPYTNKCNEWSAYVKNKNIKFVIGLATYKAVAKSENDFATDPYISSKQINFAKTLSNYGGVAFFRYDHLVSSVIDADRQNIRNALK